jgi:hypothetical protein
MREADRYATTHWMRSDADWKVDIWDYLHERPSSNHKHSSC